MITDELADLKGQPANCPLVNSEIQNGFRTDGLTDYWKGSSSSTLSDVSDELIEGSCDALSQAGVAQPCPFLASSPAPCADDAADTLDACIFSLRRTKVLLPLL